MDRDVLPNILWDSTIMRQSLGRLRQLRGRVDATMFYGHHPRAVGDDAAGCRRP